MPRARRTCPVDGAQQLRAARKAHEGRLAGVGRSVVVPGERQAVAAGEVEHPHRGLGRARPDDLQPDALDRLQRLAPGDEGGEEQVAERAVLEEQRAQRVALDGDVPQRLRHDRRQEHRLPGEEVQLAEEPAGAVADDLVAARVEDRHLTLEDRDERVAAIADV